MRERANQVVLADAYEATRQGDFEPLMGLMSDSVRWTVIGSTGLSGTTVGREEMRARIESFFTYLDGAIQLDIDKIVGAGDHVFVIASGRASSRNGERYDNRYCLVYRMEQGSVVEIEEFLDTQLLTELLAQNPNPAQEASP